MHPRNRYSRPYDLDRLAATVPELRTHFRKTDTGALTLDFSDADAVRLLNRALLLSDYDLKFWDVPPDALVPAVPGRLDYIHAVADLLSESGADASPVTGLDVGTGASLIYPVLGVREYGWRFVGTDVNATSLRAAGAIAQFNPVLKGKIDLRLQRDARKVFEGVIRPADRFAFSMCNPPFYGSEEEAQSATSRKWAKLGKAGLRQRSFGGGGAELHTVGGERGFLKTMIGGSYRFRESVTWFTALVSRRAYLSVAEGCFRKSPPRRREVIELAVGNKESRVLAWGW